MNDDDPSYASLVATFSLLSFFAIGGINSVIPEMQRQVVEVQAWMASDRFLELFAIAQAAPGPNVMVVTLIGWEIARLPGAIVVTVAMVTPTTVLTYVVGRAWWRFRHARWRIAVQNGFGPIAIGLVSASAFILARAADTSVVAALITAATAAVLYFTRINPLFMLAAGGALGLMGLV